MKFEEAKEKAGYVSTLTPPAPKVWYYAYKQGKCQEFIDLLTAKAFSPLYEAFTANQEDINEFWRLQKENEERAKTIWYNALRLEYAEWTDKQFELIYNYAFDKTPNKWDMIANEIDGLFDLLEALHKW